jgi:nicotinamidase-related amidase
MSQLTLTSREDGRMFASETDDGAKLLPERTALVVVDMINHQLTLGQTFLGDLERNGISTAYYLERVEQLVIPNHIRLLRAARQAGVKVIYLRVGAHRPDFADILPAFRESFRRWNALDGEWTCAVDERIRPEPGDISLLKSGSGGFSTSALDTHLRNMRIENVLYTGVISNGCVLLTLGAGFDLGYRGYFISDATATVSPFVQTSTEDIVGAYMAKVVSTDDILLQLRAPDSGRSAGGN